MSTQDHESVPPQNQLPTTQSHPPDVWADGPAYDAYVGRWSRIVARDFLAWLAIAPNRHWLEVGCGTGVLTQAILQYAQPAEIQAIDPSLKYVAFAREQVRDTRVHFDVSTVQSLARATSAYDVVVSGLVLNFLPQPQRALAEMIHATRDGGTLAAYVWDYAGKMQFMRHFWNAACALNPQALDADEGRRFPLCQAQPLAELFRAAGLKDVAVQALEIATDFADFEDYWVPFLGGQGPAPSYAMALPEAQREALRERLRQSLPFALDGSIPLVARAWAVRGVR